MPIVWDQEPGPNRAQDHGTKGPGPWDKGLGPAPLDKAAQLATQLPQTDGIADAAFSKHEQLMYIKIDKHIISTNELRNLVEDGSLA